MVQPVRSYILAAGPRTGSHLLSDALTATGIAGRPREWLPRYTQETLPRTADDRWRLVTQSPADPTYDPADDAERIRRFMAAGTTGNGVFGVVIHWLLQQNAVQRLRTFVGTSETAPHRVFSSAFPNLSYIWLRRRDRVAQAVSWYKAIQTGVYLGKHDKGGAGEDEALHFDYAKIRYLLTALTSFENAQERFFSSSGLAPLVLFYEDLSAQYVSTIRSILDFLQLDAGGVEIDAPKREKYADAQSREWIEQFKLQHDRARSARR